MPCLQIPSLPPKKADRFFNFLPIGQHWRIFTLEGEGDGVGEGYFSPTAD
jgi:hypothetical protein